KLDRDNKVPGLVSLMESRCAARWRVDRVCSEEAEVMESSCCQWSLTEYPNSNSWYEKVKAGKESIIQSSSQEAHENSGGAAEIHSSADRISCALHRIRKSLLKEKVAIRCIAYSMPQGDTAHMLKKVFSKCCSEGDSSTVDMDFPKHSILQAFCVMLLAWMLVRCQNPVKPEEEEEEEAMKEADNATLTTTECPLECSCTADGTVDCAGVDLTEFPEELPDKIRRLSLQNNKIKKITVEHISHLHQLETLNLQNNWLTTEGLEAEGFEMLEQLAYLYLANNKVGLKANKMASAWDAKNKRIELSSGMLLSFAF
ncbi:hypothetical protein AMECASPLE_013424, partial [Ameca splendens]